ncbi:YgzB family protein [Paenibacillus woosongensis]|uniref:YgzB family protein n=1 Tax=Paenibacillus woosongensis TaxID=307580 RepID=A0AA95KT30_9BACL|nr:YgzB family protein [Paenibacillus woosongensis]WHX48398.1 YgzB family protein [Paenibacillus woosongensis]
MFFKSSKINEFRLWGLLLTMIGMGLMVLGTAGIVFWGQSGKVIAGIGLVIGLIAMLGSLAIYFIAGMLSTSAVQLECPECHKLTKMLGKTDRCMFCRTMLTLDPERANITADQLQQQKTAAQSAD